MAAIRALPLLLLILFLPHLLEAADFNDVDRMAQLAAEEIKWDQQRTTLCWKLDKAIVLITPLENPDNASWRLDLSTCDPVNDYWHYQYIFVMPLDETVSLVGRQLTERPLQRDQRPNADPMSPNWGRIE